MPTFEPTDFASTAVPTTNNNLLLILGVVFLVILAAAGLSLVFLLLRRRLLHQKAVLTNCALQVTLPKQQKPEEERRDPKEIISVMEPLFSSFHHYCETNFWKKFWQGQPTFSFEIAAQAGEVFFYLICPIKLADAVERQIHAQYPTAHIERVKNHDIFLEKGGFSDVGALGLIKPDIFPIRTYRNLENDPLNALTNSLSKVQQGKAAIQVLIQPTEQGWQKAIETALHNIQLGKAFHQQHKLASQLGGLAKEIQQTAFSGKSAEEVKGNEAHNTTQGNIRLTAMQEQQAKQLVEKGSKLGFKVQIRCLARAANLIEAKSQVQTMLSSFAQFNAPEANGFKATAVGKRTLLVDYILHTFSRQQPTLILNTEELSSIFHFPNHILETPNIHWLGARKLAPPVNLPKSGLLLGRSRFRGQDIPVYIHGKDRMRHIYAIGQTGVGKTNLYQAMALQDIRNGEGLCFMDPNGDAVEWLLRHIPRERAEDVIYFNPADTARPLALNLLEYDTNYPEQKTMVINENMAIFDKLYDLKQTGGPIFEQYMRNAMLLVMADQSSGSTLMEIPKVLADEQFRKMKLARCSDQLVVDFWVKEAEKAGGEAALANIVPYVTSKLNQFTSSDIMRPIIGQQQSAFNFRKVMDEGKILLVSLPKGLLGDMSAALLGMIISGKIQISAFSRQNQPEEQRRPFYLYVDEFQNFTSKTFATILSEARKYALSLNITHQYIEQLDEDTRNAVFGNVGTVISWRIGAPDAEFMEKIMEPLGTDDLINVEKYNFYIRLMVDGAPSQPFNVETYAPDPHENGEVGEAIRQLSRLKYGRDRELVEAEIRLRARSMLYQGLPEDIFSLNTSNNSQRASL